MRFFSIVLLSLSILNTASAASVCFSNRTEYDAIKAKLPAMLQEIPVYFSTKNMFVAAAGNIVFKDGDLRFYFNCTRELTKPIEDRVSICATDNEIEFIFDNKVVEKVEILGPGEIKIRKKLPIEKTSQAQFASISKFVDEKTSDAAAAKNNTPSGSIQ